jgi:hypothetical protein
MEREISIILKVKGAAEAKKAVDGVFSNDAIGKVTKYTNQATKAGDATQLIGRKARSAGTDMNSFTRTLGRGMAALYLYKRAYNLIGSQFEEGMGLERATNQFERTVGSVSKMLPELREATKGTVSDFDLLKTASKAFSLGLKPEQMAGAFKMATVASQKLGLEASESINTITNALTKQDEGALNTLGITTKVNQAYATQSALVSKHGGVMSRAMGIQMRQSLILQELRKRFGGVNEVQEDGLLILDRFKSSWKNFRAVLGQTIGVALVPLVKSLTNVLDVVTSLLERVNHTEGLKSFIKLAGTLAVIWGTAKFMSTIDRMIRLVSILDSKHLGGMLGVADFAKKSGKGLSGIGNAVKTTGEVLLGFGNRIPFVGRAIKWLVEALSSIGPKLRLILGELPFIGGLLQKIPGWGLIVTAALILWKPIVAMLGTAYAAAKVFFQLLSNYEENSGLSKVLKSDADELGGFFNIIKMTSQVALVLWNVLKAVGSGISESLEPIGEMFEWIGKTLNDIGFNVGDWGKLSTNWIDKVTSGVRILTKTLVFLGSALATIASLMVSLIPGFQIFGLISAAGFGAATVSSGIGLAREVTGGKSSSDQVQPNQTQMSTQQSTPDIRPQNLNQDDDMNAILARIDKKLGNQTDIMQNDSQKQDIRESQKNADMKQWNRK